MQIKKIKEMSGWLDVSLEGFAQQNAARPIEHLVKELVQNSLDSIESGPGVISLHTKENLQGKGTWIICQDNGIGIENIENIRTIFWTSKQDSHLKRGRMGRGFKELLCLSKEVKVESLNKIAHFRIDQGTKHKLDILENPTARDGTKVEMLVDNPIKEISSVLKQYFQKLLIPNNHLFEVEALGVKPRLPKYKFSGTLTTESFEEGKWVKPQKKTEIEIHEILECESQGLIFEMGIPICPVEWELPYHVNIKQRVPMNPNRDAVMPGYTSKMHRCCLPILIEELSSEQARSAWVGEAALQSQNPTLQKQVLEKAFGTNLARAVPGFGKFDYNADAKEVAGARILDTKQLSGGFKELAKLHLPTSKEVAKKAHDHAAQVAASNDVDLTGTTKELTTIAKEIVNKHGKEHIDTICSFHKFLADSILKRVFGKNAPTCTVRVAIMAQVAEATWSNENSVLTLALDLERIWQTPLHQDNFSLLIHEVAHELAAHHGHSFADALERCAGACCLSLIENQEKLNKMIGKMDKGKQTEEPTP
jgi:anti-sigma regulatory factor (Ser/Thr protein kinase)